MIIIVGLGNPGKKYQKTRHNLGFLVINQLHKKRDGYFFSDFKFEKKFQALISEGVFNEGVFNGERIILAKPQTFMNNSGKSVKSLNSKFEIRNSKLFIIHDDIDLPLGKIRISVGRSSAGHKGVESVIRELKTKNFVRFRIGIRNYELGIRDTKKFVLDKLTKSEEKILKEVIKKTIEAIEMAIKEGVEKAMAKYN